MSNPAYKPVISVRNMLAPLASEGPKAIPLSLDFTSTGSIDVDFYNEISGAVISNVQTLYLDNSTNGNSLIVTCKTTNQVVTVQPYSQAWLPVLGPEFPAFNFATVAGVVLTVFAANVCMPANSWPVLPAATVHGVVIPTVTAGTYTSGFVIGGVLTFANVLPQTSFAGVIESLSLKFKASVQTVAMSVALFSSAPTGTFADHGAPVIASTDSAFLIGVYNLPVAYSILGTHTVYNLDGIAKATQGTSRNLYGVVIASGGATAALASTSDLIVTLGVLQG